MGLSPVFRYKARVRNGLPALLLGLAFTGCMVIATQPPDPNTPNPDPTASPTGTPTADPDPTTTSTATPTATPTASPTSSSQPDGGAQVCGSRGLPPCPADQFCDFPKDSQCGAADKGGVCKAKPQACTYEFRPVCGCDGQTYPNACAANAKGASVSKDGACN